MTRKPRPTRFKQAVYGYREVALRVFAMLCLFLIGIIIYKHFFDPFFLPGIEQRILFVLIPVGLITLALYYHLISARLRCLNARITIPRSVRKAASIVFLALLVVLVLEAVFDWELLYNYLTYLIIATIAFGALALWLNRDKIDLKAETKEEELGETKRKKEFGEKFPRLNRIPVLRWFIKWMYKEGWVYSSILILLVIIGGYLRFYNLGELCLWPDENFTFYVAKAILEDGVPTLPSGLVYSSGLLHHLLVAPLISVFGSSEFIIRLPTAILGVLIIPITYYVAKDIFGKKAALLSSLVITFSAWEMIFSRYARFHIVFQFFFMLAIFLFYKGFVEKQNITYKYLFMINVLCSLFVSKMACVLLLFPLFLMLTNKGFKWAKDVHNIVIGLFILIGSLLAFVFHSIGIAAIRGAGTQTLLERLVGTYRGEFSLYYLEVLNQISPIIILAISLGLLSIILIKANPRFIPKIYLYFILGISLAVLTVFDFVGIKNVPRYLLFVFPIIVSLVIFGFFRVILFLKKVWISSSPKWARHRAYTNLISLLICLSLIFITFNIFAGCSVAETTIGDKTYGIYDIGPSTKVYPDYRSPANFVKKHFVDGDIVISTGETPLTHQYYLNKPIQYWLRSENWVESVYIRDESYRDIYAGAALINNVDDLKEIISMHERVWILVTHSLYLGMHISEEVRGFLEKNNDKVVYWGKDGISRVYLFDSKSEVIE